MHHKIFKSMGRTKILGILNMVWFAVIFLMMIVHAFFIPSTIPDPIVDDGLPAFILMIFFFSPIIIPQIISSMGLFKGEKWGVYLSLMVNVFGSITSFRLVGSEDYFIWVPFALLFVLSIIQLFRKDE